MDEHSELERIATEMFNGVLDFRECVKCGATFSSKDNKCCGVEGKPKRIEVKFAP